MEPDKLLSKIRDIAAVSGRNEKTELLREVITTDLGKWVVSMTYDPFLTYGVKPPIPNKIEGGMNSIVFRRSLMEHLLDNLAKRELTGNAAQKEVFEVFEALDDDGREILWRIMSKDLKAGVGTSIIQTIAPNLIPAFSVMRAHVYKEGMIENWPQKVEFKLDGQRNTFLCHKGAGSFFTRSGRHVPALDYFVPNLLNVGHLAAKHPDLKDTLIDTDGDLSFMIDGEAMMGLFNETGALRRKDVDAIGAEVHLYDMMSYADFDAVGSVGKELKERRELLGVFVRIAKEMLSKTETPDMIQIVPQYFVNSHEDVEAFYLKARETTLAKYLARGDAQAEERLLKTTIDKATGKPKVLEGAMVKKINGLYDKKKSRGWLKLKAEDTEDLRIIGAFPGKPGTKYEHCLGGVIVDRKGVEIRSSGFSDEERELLWLMFQRDLAKFDSSLIQPANRGNGVVVPSVIIYQRSDLELLRRIVEIEFNEVTPDGSLRHPRYVRFRDDKDGELEDKEKAA